MRHSAVISASKRRKKEKEVSRIKKNRKQTKNKTKREAETCVKKSKSNETRTMALTTSDRAHACVSTLSCPDTVRQHLRPKKSFEKSTCPFLSTGMSATLASSGCVRGRESR